MSSVSRAASVAGVATPSTARRPLALTGILPDLFDRLGLLGPAGSRRTNAYLALRVAEGAAILAFSVYLLRTPEPVSRYDDVLQALTGVGGVILCSLLRNSGAVPRWLGLLGLIGYGVLLAGVVAEFAGGVQLDSTAGFAFLAPGPVFEVVFPFLLILRGLQLRRSIVA